MIGPLSLSIGRKKRFYRFWKPCVSKMTNDYQTFNGRTVAQTLLCVVSQKNPCPIARSISGVGGEGGHYLSLYDQVSSKTPLTPSRHIRGQFLIVNDDDNIINFYMKYSILQGYYSLGSRIQRDGRFGQNCSYETFCALHARSLDHWCCRDVSNRCEGK